MLIPFGLKNGKYFDVGEVERGRACGCVCPSCKQNLVAKKGPNPDKMIHHFAHDKKVKDEKGNPIECKYSFCVVARLVIKQCFKELEQFEVHLPDWKSNLTKEDKYGREVNVSGYVTKSQNLVINNFEVEPSGHYSELDILCRINGYEIGLHFNYSNRQIGHNYRRRHDASIVSIDLEPLQALYARFEHKAHDSFKSFVMEYVLKTGNRYWVAHARYASVHIKMKNRLRHLVEQSNQNPPMVKPKQTAVGVIKRKPYKHNLRKAEPEQMRKPGQKCLRCRNNKADYVDNLICATCLQTFYREGVFHTGSIKKIVMETCLD
ncbi:hypothetical protein GT360_08545 [Vibrio astriarenae]|uniref:Uncharacterized protein n=1 Tax=Vibrio astriarenae TaxID=1481923 RepID=A0A7Z2T3H0_9VIBR|nr:hypothetical protein [Vibrio astriarenae]QIA63562.1 hypothetical protein GT360_08545 [Vibrio astriarenae]